MSIKTDYDRLLEERSTYRLVRQEELILEVTETLSRALADSGMTRAELARRLGKSKAFVSQLFGGGRNLTLRTIADVADALDCRLTVQACPRRRQGRTETWVLSRQNWGGGEGRIWTERLTPKVVPGDFGRAADAAGAAA